MMFIRSFAAKLVLACAVVSGCSSGGPASSTQTGQMPAPAGTAPDVTAQTAPKYSPASNTQLVAAAADQSYRTIRFDVSWTNSWRNGINYDALWVFVKYRVGSGNWKHATLLTPGTAFVTGSAGGSATFSHVSDRKGVFLHRSDTGEGNFSSQGVEVPWDASADGVSANDAAQVLVFGIETVYVPGGAFFAGDGTDGTGDPGNVFHGQLRKAESNTPFRVSSEDPITLGGTAAGNMTSSGGSTPSDDFGPTVTRTLPDAYPKGFRAFWAMKNELTQGQYVDFLNTLTYTQQAGVTSQLRATPQYASVAPSSPIGTKAIVTSQGNSNYRNFVEIATPGESPGKSAVYGVDFDEDNVFDEASDGGSIACGYLTWLDGTAYADWAGLRPMSQLEYEKAARGPALPVPNEFAWGDNTFTPATGVVNAGTLQEAAANSDANVSATNLISGPVRAGMFQGPGKTRSQRGASYYGIQDLSGNVWERVAALGRPQGRSFVPNHGDGEISADGKANVSGWPGNVDGVIANGLGTGFIGGNFFRTEDFNGVFFSFALLRTSGRLYGNTEDTVRFSGNGFRGVRTADH